MFVVFAIRNIKFALPNVQNENRIFLLPLNNTDAIHFSWLGIISNFFRLEWRFWSPLKFLKYLSEFGKISYLFLLHRISVLFQISKQKPKNGFNAILSLLKYNSISFLFRLTCWFYSSFPWNHTVNLVLTKSHQHIDDI